MSSEFPELEDARISVDEPTRERHMASIARAIEASRPRRARRLRLLAVAAATILLVPVMALASERAVPGDFLYPVKQVFEPLVRVFDSDVAARHRVEEVEVLYERDAPSDVISSHIDVARETLTDFDDGGELDDLVDRIERVRTDLAERERPADRDEPADVPTDRGDRDDPVRTTSTTVTGDSTPSRDSG